MSRPLKEKSEKREQSFKTYVKNKTYEKLSEYKIQNNFPSNSYANSIILEIFFNTLEKQLKQTPINKPNSKR